MLDKVSEPSEIATARQKIAAIGPKFDPEILETTRHIYAPAGRQAQKRGEDHAGYRVWHRSSPATRPL